MEIRTENKPSSRNFGVITNDYLIQNIFSYLNMHDDKRAIYWTNKQLRPLLDSRTLKKVQGNELPPLTENIAREINLKTFRKRVSFQINSYLMYILELKSGRIACFTTTGIHLLEYNNNSLEIIKTFPIPLSISWLGISIQCNTDIILIDYHYGFIKIFDEELNEIQTIREESITSLVKVSEDSFICQDFNYIAVFTRGEDGMYSRRYELNSKSYGKYQYSMDYFSTHNLLLHGYKEIIEVYTNTRPSNHLMLTGHKDLISSISQLDNEKFASCSVDGEIKFWSVKDINSIECTKTIETKDKGNQSLILFQQDYFVSKSKATLKIWNKKTHECLNTFNESCGIRRILVFKNNSIITATTDNKVNIWKISI